ncbi:S1C family serine protease [Ammoniphilus resinae]|uniref:Serine protease Do n=1 Tax=Ammoniphilus resinae TaxID=861532 RepID=A0ABS4GPV5_9BACL|nr:S1C family serine protease [Ammoniphilus resinae]MBP1932303.1 serine protease Do [Ammoniphilus resinae]
MGYYDEQEGFYRRQKPRRFGTFFVLFTCFLSAALGGLMVLQFLPTMIESGYIRLPNQAISEAPVLSTAVTPAKTLDDGVQKLVQVKVESDSIDAVKKAENAVVGIINIQDMQDFWTRSSQSVESGTGSGVIFSSDGKQALIVTNYHVIKGAKEVEVSLPDGSRVSGQVMGSDPLTDLAVLKIPVKGNVTIATLGTSESLQAGEPAIAIGNPLGLHFSRTVTKGIISAVDRSMPLDVDEDGQNDWELDVIQTDAAINPGNSGGALININGDVIGINSLKISREGIEGLGFAIPIDDVKPIMEDLIRYGKVKRPYLGIYPKDLQTIPSYHWEKTLHLPSEVTEGIVVMDVVKRVSRDTGLQAYDVIVALEDTKVSDSASLRKYLYKKSQSEAVKVTFYRDGKRMSTSFPLYWE